MRGGNITTLASVCESVRYGYTASSNIDECGPRFLRITDIVPDLIDWASVPFCEIDDTNKERYALSIGDIVVARTGATVGYAKLVREQVDAVFASYLVRFRVDPSIADFRFIGRLVESTIYKNFVKSRIGGAAQPNANAQILGSFKFILPTKPAQERIANILSAYDELLEANRHRIQLLEESARLLYREWFVYLRFPGHEHVKIANGVPEGWEKTKLAKLCYEAKEIVNPKQVESDTPYIGLEHIPRKSITLDTWGTACEVTSTKHKYHEGDILFGKIRPYFHKVGFVLTEGIASSDSIVIRPFSDEHWPIVLMIVSSEHFVAVSSKTAKEGSKMPRADWKHMQNFPVALPPQSILNLFNDNIINITSMLKALALQNRKLKEAINLLLPRLMNGEIKVTVTKEWLAEAGKGCDKTDIVTSVRHSPSLYIIPGRAPLPFKRAVLAAGIIDKLHEEPTFGHVKFQKILYLCEKLTGVDLGTNYKRHAAGPYDPRAMRSIDGQLEKSHWFVLRDVDKARRYFPLEYKNKYVKYYDQYYKSIQPTFDNVIDTFRKMHTEQCEMVATLYEAWESLLKRGIEITEELILNEVLNHWHESKKRIAPERWLKAIEWMRQKGFCPH